MDVGIGETLSHGVAKLAEAARRQVLIDDRQNVTRGDRARDGGGIGRAILRAGGTIAQVRAQEDHDVAVDARVAEVNVRLSDGTLDLTVAQGISYLGAVLAEHGLEAAAREVGERRHFLEAAEPAEEAGFLGERGEGGEYQAEP